MENAPVSAGSKTGDISVESRDAASTRTSETNKERLPTETVTFKAALKRLQLIRRLGRGIILDIRSRAPWYLSDWTDAWNYRVVPATALIFFAKYAYSVLLSMHDFFLNTCRDSVLPGIAFSLDLIETTEQYGVAEVLLSSFMAAFIFSIFGAQPLTIAGVTGIAWYDGQM
jgi:hypothetical protein